MGSLEVAVAGMAVVSVVLITILLMRRGTHKDLAHERAVADSMDDGRPDALIVRNSNHPVLTIVPIREPALSSEGRSPLSAELLEKLRPILQEAPRLLVGGAQFATSYQRLKLILSPEGLAGVQAGVLEFVPARNIDGTFRAMLRNVGDKRFVEHANLLTQLNPAVIAAAVWQLAAVATAQKYLAEINARLASIEEGIEAIQAFLEAEVSAGLEADLLYLRDRAASIRSGEVKREELAAIVNQLESIDRDNRSRTNLLMIQLESLHDSIQPETWSSQYWSTDGQVKKIKDEIESGRTLLKKLALAAEVRIAVLGIRQALGLSGTYSSAMLDGILSDLRTAEQKWGEIRRLFNCGLPRMKALLQYQSTDRAKQDEVSMHLKSEGEELCGAFEALGIVQRLGPPAELITLEVELTPAGEIARVLGPKWAA